MTNGNLQLSQSPAQTTDVGALLQQSWENAKKTNSAQGILDYFAKAGEISAHVRNYVAGYKETHYGNAPAFPALVTSVEKKFFPFGEKGGLWENAKKAGNAQGILDYFAKAGEISAHVRNYVAGYKETHDGNAPAFPALVTSVEKKFSFAAVEQTTARTNEFLNSDILFGSVQVTRPEKGNEKKTAYDVARENGREAALAIVNAWFVPGNNNAWDAAKGLMQRATLKPDNVTDGMWGVMQQGFLAGVKDYLKENKADGLLELLAAKCTLTDVPLSSGTAITNIENAVKQLGITTLSLSNVAVAFVGEASRNPTADHGERVRELFSDKITSQISMHVFQALYGDFEPSRSGDGFIQGNRGYFLERFLYGLAAVRANESGTKLKDELLALIPKGKTLDDILALTGVPTVQKLLPEAMASQIKDSAATLKQVQSYASIYSTYKTEINGILDQLDIVSRLAFVEKTLPALREKNMLNKENLQVISDNIQFVHPSARDVFFQEALPGIIGKSVGLTNEDLGRMVALCGVLDGSFSGSDAFDARSTAFARRFYQMIPGAVDELLKSASQAFLSSLREGNPAEYTTKKQGTLTRDLFKRQPSIKPSDIRSAYTNLDLPTGIGSFGNAYDALFLKTSTSIGFVGKPGIPSLQGVSAMTFFEAIRNAAADASFRVYDPKPFRHGTESTETDIKNDAIENTHTKKTDFSHNSSGIRGGSTSGHIVTNWEKAHAMSFSASNVVSPSFLKWIGDINRFEIVGESVSKTDKLAWAHLNTADANGDNFVVFAERAGAEKPDKLNLYSYYKQDGVWSRVLLKSDDPSSQLGPINYSMNTSVNTLGEDRSLAYQEISASVFGISLYESTGFAGKPSTGLDSPELYGFALATKLGPLDLAHVSDRKNEESVTGGRWSGKDWQVTSAYWDLPKNRMDEAGATYQGNVFGNLTNLAATATKNGVDSWLSSMQGKSMGGYSLGYIDRVGMTPKTSEVGVGTGVISKDQAFLDFAIASVVYRDLSSEQGKQFVDFNTIVSSNLSENLHLQYSLSRTDEQENAPKANLNTVRLDSPKWYLGFASDYNFWLGEVQRYNLSVFGSEETQVGAFARQRKSAPSQTNATGNTEEYATGITIPYDKERGIDIVTLRATLFSSDADGYGYVVGGELLTGNAMKWILLTTGESVHTKLTSGDTENLTLQDMEEIKRNVGLYYKVRAGEAYVVLDKKGMTIKEDKEKIFESLTKTATAGGAFNWTKGPWVYSIGASGQIQNIDQSGPATSSKGLYSKQSKSASLEAAVQKNFDPTSGIDYFNLSLKLTREWAKENGVRLKDNDTIWFTGGIGW